MADPVALDDPPVRLAEERVEGTVMDPVGYTIEPFAGRPPVDALRPVVSGIVMVEVRLPAVVVPLRDTVWDSVTDAVVVLIHADFVL